MENTLKNKAKFFAQYWGQKIGVMNTDQSIKFRVGKNDLFQLIELTSLSSITDEDAIEVTKLIGRDGNRGRNIDIIKLFTVGSNWLFGSVNAILVIKASDYLRSKSYALPWMGLSVEKLIEYGWIKLTK